MSTKHKGRVSVCIKEREGELGAEGQQEEQKLLTGGDQGGRSLQEKSKG